MTNLSALEQCAQCPVGHRCSAGAALPVKCTAGTISMAGSAECSLCRSGTFQRYVGQTACNVCPTGSACAAGSTEPMPCSPGSVAAEQGATDCIACAGGSFQPDKGRTACLRCPLGAYCPAGTLAPLPCPSGTFSGETDLSSVGQCTLCPVGSSCATGSEAPLSCTPGFYTPEAGRSSCTHCEPGHNQSAEGQMGCSLCPVRTYVSITGAAECHNCLTRLSSFSGSATCNICDEGFFRRDALTEATTESCKLCFEKGARCPTNTTLETVVVLPGFWRLSNRSKQMIKCKGSAAVKRCIGGMDAGFSGEGYCSERYTGPECLLCREGKGFYRHNDECVDCPEVGGRLAVLAGLVVAVSVTTPAVYAALFSLWGGHVAALRPLRRTVAWLRSYVDHVGLSAKLKILFSFYSIVAVLDTSYDASMPESYTDTVDAVFGWANVDEWFSSLVFPLECISFASSGSRFRSWLLVKGLAPLFAIVLAILGTITAKCTRLGWGQQNAIAGLFKAMPLAFVISFLFMPSVSMTIFQSFLCVEYQFDAKDVEDVSTYSYLLSDLHIRCTEGGYSGAEHNVVKLIAAAFIFIWPVGVVALLTVVLMLARVSLLARKVTPLVRGTRFLHREYEVDCFYWEILELIRRTFLSGWVLFIFSTEQTFLRLVAALLYSVAALVLLLTIRPYRRSEDHFLAAGCQLVIVFSFIGAMLIRLFEEFSTVYSTAVVHQVMVFRSATAIANPLLFLTMIMVLLMLLIMTVIIHKETKLLAIRLEATGAPPALNLCKGQKWHLFLSHTWSTGQVCCQLYAFTLHACSTLPETHPAITHLSSGRQCHNQAAAAATSSRRVYLP